MIHAMRQLAFPAGCLATLRASAVAGRWSQWLLLGLLLAPLALAEELPILPGSAGAISIPLQMPQAGKATIALYTPSGQLLRILAQAVPLPAGPFQVRWDGLDLWGHQLPAETQLECRLLTHPGLQVTYEYSIGGGNRDDGTPPWLTRGTGEGLARRQGGWLGDHSGPSAVLALGDRLYIGSAVAEHGDSLVVTDLAGHKLWGGGLAGWNGPTELWADGERAIIGRLDNTLWTIDPLSYERRRLASTSPHRLLATAVHAGTLHLILRNQAADASPFPMAVSERDFDFVRSVPQMLGSSAPDYQISERARLATVFYRGWHFQTGVRSVRRGQSAYIIAPFTAPKALGALAIGRVAQAARVEVYGLKAGLNYTAERHSPLERPAVQPGDLRALDAPEDLNELSPDWELLGASDNALPVTIVPLARAETKTSALLLRLRAPKGVEDNWAPTVAHCRLLAPRVERLPAKPRLILPPDAEVAKDAPPTGWRFRAAAPCTELAPVRLILDYGSPQEADGLAFLNHVNGEFVVAGWDGPGDPTQAGDDEWRELTRYRAYSNAKNGSHAASTYHNDVFLHFPARSRFRALRLYFPTGHQSGRQALTRTETDPQRFACDDLALLRLLDRAERPPNFLYQERDAITGELRRELATDSAATSDWTAGPDGTLFSWHAGQLRRTVVGTTGLTHTVLNERDLPTAPRQMQVVGQELLISTGAQLRYFDLNGKPTRTLDGRGYQRGPWDPDRFERPSGVTVDRHGKLWLAEAAYAPKRLARFNAAGKCELEFIGPPEYGGGGYLHADLKRFFYRGLEYAVDHAAGTSRLAAINDRLYTEETPALEASSFAYTKVGRPLRYQGREYAVGDPGAQGSPGVVIVMLVNGLWRPAAVMGAAAGSPFLLRKAWRDHWLRQDLTQQAFIWCDANDDGQYQVAEVELFKLEQAKANPFGGAYWGSWLGPDLSYFSSATRLAPSRFTAGGVPIYEAAKLQRWRYEDLAPIYHRALTGGGRAKIGYGGAAMVSANGALWLEGQPYRVGPDLRLLGGGPVGAPSDYQPPILGEIMNQPLHFVGSAPTTGAAGEVTMMNGNNGHWSVLSVDHQVLLDVIFTGRAGSFSSLAKEQRGQVVTDYKQDWETFFGHFTRSDTGEYFVVAGKGYHGIHRVSGLDEVRVQRVALTVPAASIADNATLRTLRRDQASSWDEARQKRLAGRSWTLKDLKTRLPLGFKLDGLVEEWGHADALQALDEQWDPRDPPPRFFVAGAWDAQGLVLAWRGHSFIGNAAGEARELFHRGFGLELAWRAKGDERSDKLVAGDRRLVLGKLSGEWRAVLYDFVNDQVAPEAQVSYRSPVAETRIARVTILPAASYELRVVEANLDGGEGAATPAGPGQFWSAELRLPWAALGFDKKPDKLRADLGVLLPDSGGLKVERVLRWAHPGPHPVSDVAFEARIEPTRFGTLLLE